ncbi:MAG: hypothetical protein JXB88_10520 [Spirochaetales bacterium]|nr:hypothetical protein [Spirochaetales bacterium]
MIKKFIYIIITGFLAAGCSLYNDEINRKPVNGVTRASTQDNQYRTLAEYWSPRFYQDMDDTNYKGDVLTKFNFDGDYNGRNNWENLLSYNLGDHALKACVYYSVVETSNFYFIGYYTFHPMDWENIDFDSVSHENDLEGVLLAVKKTGGNGTLICAITEAHNHFYQYQAPGQSLSTGSDNIDGTLNMYGTHPKIFIQAKGHGVFYHDNGSAPGGDGIVYYCSSTTADSPASGSGNWTGTYRYMLIAMDSSSPDQGFWYRRNQIGNDNTFSAWGIIRGDTYGDNKAKVPWAWDDPDDGEVFSGDLLCDPAHLIDCQLNGPALNGMSHSYVNNIYATHKFEILAVQSDKNRDPLGGKSDIYVKVNAPGAAEGTDDILDARAWKKNSASTGTYYNFQYGGYDAEGQKTYTETIRTHYFARYGSPGVVFSVYDSDTDSDDHMGSITLYNSVNYSSGVDLGDARIKFIFTKF